MNLLEHWDGGSNWPGMNMRESKVEVKPNYEIKDGKLITPVKEVFHLNFAFITYASANTTSKNKVSDVLRDKEFTSIEDAKEFIQHDIEYVSSVAERQAWDLRITDQIMHIQSIQLFKAENIDYPDFNYPGSGSILSKKAVLTTDEIVKLVEASPLYEKAKQVIEDREKERKELAIKEERSRSKQVRKNNYEMWKVLNAKMNAGDFDEFIEE